MKRYLYLFVPLLLQAETKLEDINISASAESTDMNFLVEQEGYMKNAPMQKQIRTQDALLIAGTNGDPIKALKSFAGVVSSSNDGGSDIYIHGSKPRETLFTINQLPLGYVFHAGGIHSVVAPEATEQIDAYLGGFDTRYDAMGAVVDITPKFPKGSNKGRLHLGMYDADFAYDASLGEETSLFLSGRRSYFDFIASKVLDELESDERDESKKTTFTLFPQYYDASMILSHNSDNSSYSLEFIKAQDEMRLHTTMNKTKDPRANGKIDAKYGFTTLGARWNYSGENFESMTLLSEMKSDADNSFFDEDFFVKSSTTEDKLYHETLFDLDGHRPLVGVELKRVKAPVKVHSTKPKGADDFDTLVSDDEVVDLDKTFRFKSYTIFAQDIWDVTPSDHIRYGVRAWKTDFQEFGSGVDPRVAYVHDFSDTLTASVAVGQYSQEPEVTYVIDGFGNPLIDTQESANHYTLNVSKEFGNGSSLVVEPYYKEFENLAIADHERRYESVGEGEAYGVDVTYKRKVEDVDVTVAYTYVKAKRQLNTNSKKQYRFEGDTPHTLQVNASYTFDNDWRVSSLAKYSSGSPYTPVESVEKAEFNGQSYNRPIYGTPYSKRMPSTLDLDVQVSKTFHHKGGTSLEVALELMNLNALFKENIDEYRYDDEYKRDGEYKQMGFIPAVHLTYRF